MSHWISLLQKPENLGETESINTWFDRIASQLLFCSYLVVGDEPHRLVEIEFYYFADAHPDPFTHRDRIQLECGRWYFHRTRGTYRSGSFKGLDLTFGDGQAFGGILIRSIATPDGKLIDGPSLCVDYLLAKAGAMGVAELDEAIASRVAWDTDNPLFLQWVATDNHQFYRSARVGLSLKKAQLSSEMPQYILLPYRYLTEPRRITKGKPYLVLSLYIQGLDSTAIHQLTGCPKQSIQRYIEDFAAGQQEIDFTAYFGIELNSKQLCKLHGTWQANMKKSALK
jgi:hypothetical protein